MDFSMLNSIITVISLVIFLGILYWAYAKQNKERFEAIGKSLLEIDTELNIDPTRTEK
jgi:cytochrome c oxidase cbb3-type subunit 4